MSEQLGIDEVMKGEAEIEFRSQLGIAEREILDVDNDVLVDFFNSILRNMSSSNAQEVLRSLLDYMEKEKNMFNPVLYEIVSFRLKLIMNCDSMPGLSKKEIENILELNVFVITLMRIQWNRLGDLLEQKNIACRIG